MACPHSESITFGTGIYGTEDEFLKEVHSQLDEMIICTAHRGDQDENIRQSVREIHELMKKNYAVMIHTVGNTSIYPIIVAADIEPGFEGVGSSFTLYNRDGSIKRINVVSRDYEFYKALSHMPLGLFTIISGFFRSPDSINWIGRLQEYKTKVDAARFALRHGKEFPKDLKQHAETMLKMVEEFIDERIRARHVDRVTFQAFGLKIFPYVYKGLKTSSQLQVDANMPALKQLKKELGPELWREVYVVIPTVWPVSGVNPRQQILQQLMDKDRIDSHIVLTENAFSHQAARECVGRVVADRLMAQLFFGVQQEEKRTLNFQLSSKRDLVSTACDDAIKAYLEANIEVPSTDAPASE